VRRSSYLSAWWIEFDDGAPAGAASSPVNEPDKMTERRKLPARAGIGGATSDGMHPKMKSLQVLGRALGAAGLVFALTACAHHAPASSNSPEAVAALQPPAPPEAGPTYRIQFGDELHVRFLYQPDMNEQVPVRPDGRISLVSTGQIEAVGLTPVDLEHLIAERSSGHLRNPEVTVIVTKLGEQRVYVGGEVAQPGYVILRVGMTPLQAVLQTGGFRTTAKRESVLLLTPGTDGRFSAARIDMKQVTDDGVPERVRLRPNDVVYVPRTWIADMDLVVDQYVRGLIPALPKVGVGASMNQL
jgi:polysaccharide export outer membrane protein